MIITVGNTKGGVGKTTLAINIAVARALMDKDVWIVDGDEQGTAEIAISIRMQRDKRPMIACSKFTKGEILLPQVNYQGYRYHDVVIDAGGRDNSALRAALLCSDVLLIPFAAKSFDIWGLADISNLVEEAQKGNPRLIAYVVLNNTDSYSKKDMDEAEKQVADYPLLNFIRTPIMRRKSVSTAAGNGLSVLEHKPTDVKACKELLALVEAVFSTEKD